MFSPFLSAQAPDGRTLSGPDAHDSPLGLSGRLTGDWGGARRTLKERGVDFDFEYISDSLWNVKSDKSDRLASWNRGRGTVDIDLGALIHQPGFSFHATALWQGGGNLGTYLGTETSPSGMSSFNLFRLDSWWMEKQWRHDRVAMRIGQFAGQDFYGDQHYGTSFIFEPMGYALSNLSTTFETGSPGSTSALELTAAPMHNVYVASMVLDGDRLAFFHNTTGFVPQFRGAPISVSEIGYTPGKKTLAMRPADDVSTRRGYSGMYKFGASFNPGRFTTSTGTLRSGNYLMYWMANQAVWRRDPTEGKGLDVTAAYDWSPTNVNSDNRELTTGLRFNEPLTLPIHNTLAVGYVRNKLNPLFLPYGATPYKAEQGIEGNMLFNLRPMILLQPTFQYFANVGGGPQRAFVAGFRARVEF
ncbi:carbohydrate porin [Granulicella aggregans]|uniref:carbohydrate porin n=1 Tax=Granulicella aggregans TaxID=474949 RepID=UPI0021E00C50|nr:carbohydrate porin [Granulicella aggregans]